MNAPNSWTADTDIYFLLKFGVHAGIVVSQGRGHAKALAERNVAKFLYAEKTYRYQPVQGIRIMHEKRYCLRNIKGFFAKSWLGFTSKMFQIKRNFRTFLM